MYNWNFVYVLSVISIESILVLLTPEKYVLNRNEISCQMYLLNINKNIM